MHTKKITLTSLFAALLFVSSYFKLPIGPVPVTTQTFFVLLIGMLLPPSLAILATVANLVLQSIFQNAFTSVTFGFIIGFIVCATLISFLKNRVHSWFWYCILLVIGSLAIYAVGVPYFVFMTSGKYTLLSALSVTMTPFLIGDAIKAIVASFVVTRLKSISTQ